MKIALPGADGAYDPRLRAADFRGVRPFAAPGRVVPFSATFTAGVGERHVNVWRLPTVPFLIRGAIFSVAGVTQDGTPERYRTDLQWLPDADTIGWWFRETAHGLKVLYRGGLLLEFAVFDQSRCEPDSHSFEAAATFARELLEG